MNKSTFESLPNELLLIIFSYLSSFDLCQAFLYINNPRIQSLLTFISHSLNVTFMQHDQLHLWLNNNPNQRNRFNNLIDTLIFDHSCACESLLEYWEKSFKENGQHNVLFPSVKRIIVLGAECISYSLFGPILKPLVFANDTLQYLHLITKEGTLSYLNMLSRFIDYRVSVHTMILEVELGMLLALLSG